MKYIKKNIAIACMAIGMLSLGACNDFLDRQPLDKVTAESYLKTEGDLAAFAIKQYEIFPNVVNNYSIGPIALGDDHSDNQAKTNGELKYWQPGQWRVREKEEKGELKDQEWSFYRIRAFNFFFQEVLPKYEAGAIQGTQSNIDQYIGEVYFLRAYEYFKRLKMFGDFPIVTEVLVDDKELLIASSQRQPRNKVARFILEDLDKAIGLLSNDIGNKNRITRDVALLFKSRVALYEASFETYHRGTPRVPGEGGWPGAAMDYNKDFSINLDQEIAFFLDEALAASKEVADKITLTPNSGRNSPNYGQTSGWNPYFEMFADIDMSGYSEVLMWHSFNAAENVGNCFQNNTLSGSDTGLTRGFMETFLMENGLPIYASGSGYSKIDSTLDLVKKDRDGRLQLFLAGEHSIRSVYAEADTSKYMGVPDIIISGETRKVTGYVALKGVNYIYDADNLPSGTSQEGGSIFFRGVEAYLNYIEASCLKNGGNSIDGTARSYWKAIRERGGVDSDIDKTIAATDLNQENDWAVYSGGTPVSSIMYNIRRERRCEFMWEGMRWDDLIRWRALDQVKNYIIEGCNLWDNMYKADRFYDKTAGESKLIPAGTPGKVANVSSKEKSGKYLRPYQVVENNNGLYNGYTWMKANYLHPICITHMRISANDQNDVGTSPIYQNPYWPSEPNASQLE